jgi:hypothetical protein
MKKAIRDLIFAGSFILTVAAVVYISPPARIRRQMSDLAVSPDIREIAAACSTLLTSSSGDRVLYLPNDREQVPNVIASKRPQSVFINPASRIVTIEFGGGFFHYGYRLEPQPSDPNHSRFLLYGEEPEDTRELLQF